MRERLSTFCLLALGLTAGSARAQSSSDAQIVPLCELQTKLLQAEHRYVQVEGVYLSGLEGQYLSDLRMFGQKYFHRVRAKDTSTLEAAAAALESDE